MPKGKVQSKRSSSGGSVHGWFSTLLIWLALGLGSIQSLFLVITFITLTLFIHNNTLTMMKLVQILGSGIFIIGIGISWRKLFIGGLIALLGGIIFNLGYYQMSGFIPVHWFWRSLWVPPVLLLMIGYRNKA